MAAGGQRRVTEPIRSRTRRTRGSQVGAVQLGRRDEAGWPVSSTVESLFRAAELEPVGAVRWTESIPLNVPGVYAVARTDDPASHIAPWPECPIDNERIEHLLSVRPELLLDGLRPSPDRLASRLAEFWLPDEPVQYIGLAGTSLCKRVGQYRRSKLGANRPHAGGWWLKTLTGIQDLWVHYSPCVDPDGVELAMLRAFESGVSRASRESLPDQSIVLPFANLERRENGTKHRKAHGLRNATGSLA